MNANKKSDRGTTAGKCECAKEGEGLGDKKQCEETHKNNNTIYLSSDESDDAYSTESESEDESEDESDLSAPPRGVARYRRYDLKNGKVAKMGQEDS